MAFISCLSLFIPDLINHLSDARLDNLPTCGYAQLSAEIDSWIQVKQTEFQLKHLLKPKMFKDSI
ncbi:MAG: hypothetical protein DWP95_06800 [Proteobacteria bacterium]|nr:MAG: hypothetical protein DWP95_06800 [Pseudomonadota bacterium]